MQGKKYGMAIEMLNCFVAGFFWYGVWVAFVCVA